MKPLHIFKPGKHTAMSGDSFNFSETDLAATVRAYDPALHEAPLVIGHPKHDAPAAGWVKSLQANAEGLIAEPQQVDPAFAEQVGKGSYKKISASFYHPDAPNNPVPGVYYLRHVGFLGAQPPAVKGLRAIELADGEEGVVEFGDFGHESSASLWRKFREFLIAQFGAETADQVTPAWQIDSISEAARRDDLRLPAFSDPVTQSPVTEEPTVNPEEIAALQAENIRLKAQAKQHQDTQREQALAITHTANVAFAEQLVGEGKLLPKHAEALIATLDFAGAGDAPLEFGEGDQRKPVADGLKAIFGDLPKQISFAEQADKKRHEGGQLTAAELDFADVETDPDRLNLHARASQLASEKNIPYESAVRQLINQ
ncbi:phage protease [Pseudomonas anguilliseptica]|nr:phage protease [Pseudomonas anguilliseptica]